MLIPTQDRVEFVVVELSSNLTGRTLIANNSIKTLRIKQLCIGKKQIFLMWFLNVGHGYYLCHSGTLHDPIWHRNNKNRRQI